jgi:hypothetical protein
MKYRYLTLAGLLVSTLGSFLPFQIDMDGTDNSHFWFLPILGIVFLLISKEGLFGSGRILGGLFGLLIGIVTIFSIINALSMPDDAGYYMAYQGPITLLAGSFLAGVGGFKEQKRTYSRRFRLGVILSLVGIGIITIFLLLVFIPQTFDFIISLLPPGYSLGWIMYFSLAVILVSSIIIVEETLRIM